MDYFLCTTPRAGSNLLGGLLFQTGVAGDPQEFLCHTQVERRGGQLCGFGSLEEASAQLNRYYQAVRQEFTVGGQFALKLHYKQFQWALDRQFDLEGFFPERIVYLTRGDLVAQAISRVRARQTGAWISRAEETQEPEFDPELIERAVQELVLENQGWEAFFHAVEVDPLRLTYEDLCGGFHEQLAGVLRYLDLDPTKVDVLGAVERATDFLRPQRDGVNADWRRRYEANLLERARERALLMGAAPAA